MSKLPWFTAPRDIDKFVAPPEDDYGGLYADWQARSLFDYEPEADTWSNGLRAFVLRCWRLLVSTIGGQP